MWWSVSLQLWHIILYWCAHCNFRCGGDDGGCIYLCGGEYIYIYIYIILYYIILPPPCTVEVAMSSILCARAARKQTTTSGAATTYYYHHHTVQVTILRPPHAFLDGNDCHHHRHSVQITMHTFSICTIALEKNTTATTTTQCKLQYHSHHHLCQ